MSALLVFWSISTSFALGGMDFNFIGFSESGSHLAFEQYGIQDGFGFAQSEIFVVDVDDNSYVVAPFAKSSQDDESQSLEQIRTANLDEKDQYSHSTDIKLMIAITM